jgi:methenyltetrahydrofolate cyclohydrolase
MTKLMGLKVGEFVDLLASNEPAPGGGSVAALAGAQAAALMAMVCRLTIGKKKYVEVEAEVVAALSRLDSLQAELVALVDEDTEAYNVFGAAMGMPKETDEQKATRREAMRAAAKFATEVPAKTLAAAALVAREIAALYGKTNKNCLSDAGTGLQLAWSAIVGASMNVRINLPSTGDEDFSAAHAARVKQIEDEIGPLVEQAVEAIQRSLT